MKRSLWIAILLGVAISLGVVGLVSAAAPPSPELAQPTEPSSPALVPVAARSGVSPLIGPDNELKLIDSGARSLTIELVTIDYAVDVSTGLDGPCDTISVDGYGVAGDPGAPGLPVRTVMVGVPADADLSLTILELETIDVPGLHDICPAPSPFLERDEEGETAAGVRVVRDPAAYAAQGFVPDVLAEVVSTGFIRSQRVAQIRLHPFQYDPATGKLRRHQRIRVRLDFGIPPGAIGAGDSSVDEGSFEALLSEAILNYEDARGFRSSARSGARRAWAAGGGDPSYKISVDQEGIYEISCGDLYASGIPTDTLDPRTLRLSNRGQEVAIAVTGEEDGSCDEGDTILFYAEAVRTRFTRTNVYWLRWGAGLGLRMPLVDGTPLGADTPAYFTATARAEENTAEYFSDLPSGPELDHWYWDVIWADSPTTQTYSIDLTGVAVAPTSATVRGLFKSYDAEPQHHTILYLNGHLVADETWPAQGELLLEATVPQTYLIEGTNVFSIVAPLDMGITGDYFLLDWFEIDYARKYEAVDDTLTFASDSAVPLDLGVGGYSTETVEIFDVTSPYSPTQVVSAASAPISAAYVITFGQSVSGAHRYIALAPDRRLIPLAIEEDIPSDLRASGNGADYIVITHRDFISAANELAQYRASQGLRTIVIDVQDVYDEFNGGVFDPEAIRDFLAYAYANWMPPAPAYVVLMGDGHYDFLDDYGYHDPSFIPPYLADVDRWIGETAADNRYVCVSGGDNLPDMFLGRLPVRTTEQANGVVAKIKQYEVGSPGEDWRRRTLCIADEYDPDAGDFAASCEEIDSNHLAPPYTQQKIYYGITHGTPEAMRAAIVESINEGRLLVQFSGHSSVQFWSDKVFRVQDIALLTNTERYPVMTPMTCLDGYYIWPVRPGKDYTSLGEAVVREPGKGAVASFSPTGYGETLGHDMMSAVLYESLLSDGVTELGAATTLAKLAVNGTSYAYLIDAYLLFGDPALNLNGLRSSATITKSVAPSGWVYAGEMLTYTVSFSNAGPDITQAIIADDLPAGLVQASVASSGAPITAQEGTRFVWIAPELAPGVGGTITITAIVSDTFAGVLTNTATIALTTIETDTTDNRATVTTIVPFAAYLPLSIRAN